MPPVMLKGDTLGKKRQHYNKLVKDAIANEHYELCNISGDDSDIDNLLKIDIASKNRNVDYIIEVMRGNDMLYAATAIKKSTWLITDRQYANVINPEYLYIQLLPSMNTKTFNKLMLHIRLNLKDESRVETFYEYLKEMDGAYKWLQNCSIPFIENVINKERLIPMPLFKRLCRRSAHFARYHCWASPSIYDAKQEILFLLKSWTANILNILEKNDHVCFPPLGKKKTEIIMKTCPQRVFGDFENYANKLDLSVVAKYLKKKEIKTFLNEVVQKRYGDYLCCYENLGYFIKNMLEEERFEFVKKTFIDKTERVVLHAEYEEKIINSHIKSYQWYEYAPFNVALTEFKKLIRREKSPSERCAMLSVLITCAKRNPQHIETVLNFFYEKHINEPLEFKIQFINKLVSQISIHKLNVKTWNVLDELFHIMEVYTQSENNVQLCVESIILYKVLHDEPVPEIIEQRTTFNTFQKIQRKLNQEQNEKLFTYLLNSVLTKVQSESITNESNFCETIVKLKNALTLLRDWEKDITKYPFVLGKIQELNKLKQENLWKADLSGLYNMKKSWRKHMFEESLSLCPSEEACLNALKHKPLLLTHHDQQIDALRTNDAVSLRRLLAKLRVYWPHSLAQHWTDAYLKNLNKPTGLKAAVKGLFMILPQNQIIELAKKHVPDDFKVNWGETGQTKISIRKNIAKYLHLARPLIPLDTVLCYAKGDYLQYAVPSLNAILSKLSEVESRKYLPKLLDAPVSLQKFGLHLAAFKLKSHDLKSIFTKIWNTSKNLTIRSGLFNHIYAQIRKAKDSTVEKELWEILSMFVDNLTSGESAQIYKNLGHVQSVPISIRAEFYMKSYEFLSSLPASANCEEYVKDLIEYAPKIMEFLEEDFIVNKILSPAGTKFCSHGSEVIEVFACYVLCGNSEEDQLQRFRRVIDPAMEEAFQLWDNTRSGDYYVKDNFNNFLSRLVWNFRIYYFTLNKKILPVQLFVEIKNKMEKGLPLLENYVLYTSWKLVTDYIKVMDEQKSMFSAVESSNFDFGNELEWKDIHFKISPSLGPVIVQRLKEDTEQYNFSTIYCLFTEAFLKMFQELLSFQDDQLVFKTLQDMLNDDDFIPSYFFVSKATSDYCYILLWPECKMRLDIRKKLQSHPSKAVRMHYCNDFRKISEDCDLTLNHLPPVTVTATNSWIQILRCMCVVGYCAFMYLFCIFNRVARAFIDWINARI